MKYLFILFCFATTWLTAQTTQPTTQSARSQPTTSKTMKKEAMNKAKATTQPTTSKTMKKEAMNKAKATTQPNKMASTGGEDIMSTKGLSVEDEAKMAKYGLAVSEKNSLGGLQEGGQAPNFSAKDQNGNPISLQDELKNGKVVVVFYRGVWCGICNKALSEFETELKSITDKGAKVIAISTESSESAQNTIEQNGITFSVISDTDGQIAKDYKVLYEVSEDYQNKVQKYSKSTLQSFNNSDEALLPVPATYIIDQDGTISWHQYSIDYSDRATVAEIVEQL